METQNDDLLRYKRISLYFLISEVIILCLWVFENYRILNVVTDPENQGAAVFPFEIFSLMSITVIAYILFSIVVTLIINRKLTRMTPVKNLGTKLLLIFIFTIIPATALTCFLHLLSN
ncbi:hypothetical protein ACFGVR_00900 [Mucilaginibacter sp. AW1-3]